MLGRRRCRKRAGRPVLLVAGNAARRTRAHATGGSLARSESAAGADDNGSRGFLGEALSAGEAGVEPEISEACLAGEGVGNGPGGLFYSLRETPRVGRGRTPLVVHLLAPNQRPVQTTTDLAGFWERLYPQVRRELSRRYPKHSWPEQP